MYMSGTRDKVERFLVKKGVAWKRELQFLGKIKMQVNHYRLAEILADLERDGKVRVERVELGKRVFMRVIWCDSERK
jgi:hypothetical protein